MRDDREFVTAVITAKTILRYIAEIFGCEGACTPIIKKEGYSYFRIKGRDSSFFNISFAPRSSYNNAIARKMGSTWILPSYFLSREEKERIFSELLEAIRNFFSSVNPSAVR